MLLILSLFQELLNDNALDTCKSSKLLSVYAAAVGLNNGEKITNLTSCAKVLLAACQNKSKESCDLLCKIVVTLVEGKCSGMDTEVFDKLQPVIKDLLEYPELSYEMLETLDKTLRSYRVYFRMFLESVIPAYERTEIPTYVQDCKNITVYCLSEAILQQGGFMQLPNSSEHYFNGNNAPMYYFQSHRRIITVLNLSILKGDFWDW